MLHLQPKNLRSSTFLAHRRAHHLKVLTLTLATPLHDSPLDKRGTLPLRYIVSMTMTGTPSATFNKPSVVRRICLSAHAEDVDLLQTLSKRLRAITGKAGYVDVIRYALRLAAAHLDAGEAPVPLRAPVPGAKR